MQRDIMFAKQVKAMCEANDIPCILNDGMKSVDEEYETVKSVLGISLGNSSLPSQWVS